MTMEAKDWTKPTEVSDVTMAFPADVLDLMPAYEEIPNEFKRHGNPWTKWQGEWFFSGLKGFPAAKPGIDVQMAGRHLSCIQGSFQPKHEHKQAAVAYLASLWLESPTPTESSTPTR